MNPIKRLASDTAIYGVSSILGRVLNYLLIILHTSVFLPEQLEIITVLFSNVAIVNVLFTFGFETTFFRFITKSKDPKIYHYAATVVILISTTIGLFLFINATNIASYLGYSEAILYVKWLILILWLDAVIAIPFAKLRIENRPIKFASSKVAMIAISIGLQLLFLYFLPNISKGNFLPSLQSLTIKLYDPSLGVGYIILANLISSAFVYLFLWKEVLSIRIRLNWENMKPMLLYAIPVMLTGLAGMLNENFDKAFFKQIIPENFYTNISNEKALGVYGQVFKLSVFMTLGIQAFRFAAEPFFFSKAKDKQSPVLFAQVMHYFVLANLVIFVCISLNIDLLGSIFLKKQEYWAGLFVVPYLLIGKFFFGIYVNLSIWYKLTDQTIYGVYIACTGVVVTIISNLILVPLYGYLGSALASIPCYLSMVIVCYITGQKHFPIPYQFKPLIVHFIIAVFLVFGMHSWSPFQGMAKTIACLSISAIYTIIIYFIGRAEKEKPAINYN